MNLAIEFLKNTVQPLSLSLLILLAAWLLVPYADLIPTSFSGLWKYGPHLLLAYLAVLGVAFNRGRALLVALLVALPLSLREDLFPLGVWEQPDFENAIVTVFVPLNLALVGWYMERGLLTGFGLIRLAIILVPLIALGASWYFWPESFSAALHSLQVDWIETGEGTPFPYPQLCYLIMALSGVSLLASAYVHRTNVCFALFVGYCGYLAGVLAPDQSNLFHANMIALGLILCISILRDSHSMAYRDDLTGLPQRRALNELFMSLGGDYAIAMIDVDHFKKFNDTHGHDVGDDVLKLVASRIDKVKDGGRAFRYGGEEFTVVYPSKVKEQALRSLEALREAIASYQMVVRAPRLARADGGESAAAERGKGAPPDAKKVSVTISIGVADKADRNESPDDVLKKADKALYQAKKAGRNRVAVWREPRPRQA